MPARFLRPLCLAACCALLLIACSRKHEAESPSAVLVAPSAREQVMERKLAEPPKPASAPGQAAYRAPEETAKYDEYKDNAFQEVVTAPLSTFGLDMDTASYANVRRFLNQGRMPNPDAVRVEEMLNYFPAGRDMLSRLGDSPFSASYELAPCPWNPKNLLLYLTLKADDVRADQRPRSNLVFLVDVSGSMNPPERLPLVKSLLKVLTGNLGSGDTVSLVTYSGGTQVVLGPTSGADKAAILAAVDRLEAGGGTAGASGLALAYEQAQKGFIKGGVNRVLLCTDGDFNLGVTDPKQIQAMVEKGRDAGITLSALGFGSDNYNESLMVRIADNGNGNYSYIDTLSEGQKVLGEEMTATLTTVAKDAKAQIEFNPARVQAYRQIGYEKRQLKAEDFNNDAVDAGDIGAGKRVTILYELVPAGAATPKVDPSRYGTPPAVNRNFSDELAFVKIRWKAPHGDKSKLVSLPITKTPAQNFAQAGEPLRFAAAVAAYGQKLRGNPELGNTSWSDIAAWGRGASSDDPGGWKSEFARLVGLAESLAPKTSR